MQHNNYNKLKGLANHINHLIETGKWNTLDKTRQNALKKVLVKLINQVRRFVAKRKLARALGAAVTLISANASAQSFADPVINPFTMGNNTYFSKPEFVDLDGDGDLDFFHSNTDLGVFFYQENIGTITAPEFSDAVVNPFELDPISYSFTPVFGDLDNDGDFDFLSANYDDGVLLYYENIGTATEAEFATEVSMPFGIMTEYSFPNDLVDIDDDGDLDLFVSSYDFDGYYGGVRFFYHENIGTAESPEFAAAVIDPFGIDVHTEDFFTFIDFADIDADGDLDFMRVELYGKTVYYHENIGDAESPEFDGGLGESSPFDIDVLGDEQYFFAPSFADIDADGDYDLFVGEYYGGTFFFENRTIVVGLPNSDLPNDKISLFPNPTTDFINLDVDLTNVDIQSIQITTVEGRQVYHSQTMVNSIDVNNYPAGLYILAIKHATGEQTHQKFIKE